MLFRISYLHLASLRHAHRIVLGAFAHSIYLVRGYAKPRYVKPSGRIFVCSSCLLVRQALLYFEDPVGTRAAYHHSSAFSVGMGIPPADLQREMPWSLQGLGNLIFGMEIDMRIESLGEARFRCSEQARGPSAFGSLSTRQLVLVTISHSSEKTTRRQVHLSAFH